MRQLEAADPSCDGAGEGAPLMAKQLALEEPGGNCGAVELDEGASAPGAVRVDQVGDQLLARSRLAPDEHDGVGGCHGPDQAEHSPERQTRADDSVGGVRVQWVVTRLHSPRRIRAAARRGAEIVGPPCLLADR